MKQEKKLQLKAIKVKSFVTILDQKELNGVKSGIDTNVCSRTVTQAVIFC